MKRKTPQQKKAESLANDRRNAYGNSDKAARSAVPARKRHRSQAERRLAKQGLVGAAHDEAQVDGAIGKVLLKRRNAWQKWPDEPLGEVLSRKGKR